MVGENRGMSNLLILSIFLIIIGSVVLAVGLQEAFGDTMKCTGDYNWGTGQIELMLCEIKVFNYHLNGTTIAEEGTYGGFTTFDEAQEFFKGRIAFWKV